MWLDLARVDDALFVQIKQNPLILSALFFEEGDTSVFANTESIGADVKVLLSAYEGMAEPHVFRFCGASVLSIGDAILILVQNRWGRSVGQHT